MSERLVCTLAFGRPKFAEMALGLGRSLRLIGDTTARGIVTDIDGPPWERTFDVVIRTTIPPEEMWWSKFLVREHTDAKQILFIDSDCLAYRRLDDIFEFFAGASLGVQGEWMCEGEWYGKDIRDVCASEGIPAMPMFNAGLLYFEPGQELDRLITEGRAVAGRASEIGWRLARGFPSEEVCLSLAMAKTGLGRVASDSANFQSSGVGMIGPLDLSVSQDRLRFVCRRHRLELVQPNLFHAHFYGKYLGYWRELARLERLERYADRHPFGYESPFRRAGGLVQTLFTNESRKPR